MSPSQHPLSGIEAIRALYKSLAACSEHQTPGFLRELHIGTSVDDAIVLAANEGRVVVVTGNPGDGKTHLIRKVREDLNKRVVVMQDANEVEDLALVRAIDEALAAKRGLVLAINEGILLGICESAKGKYPWASRTMEMVLRPYDYGPQDPRPESRIALFDLNLRNNLSISTVEAAIDKMVAIARSSKDGARPYQHNLDALRLNEVRSRICVLLDAVGQTGFHATMRDLLGFIAFLLTGDSDGESNEVIPPYFLNAFEGGQGPLFDQVRALDPLLMPSPFLDDRLYMMEDLDEEWLVHAPSEPRAREDLSAFRLRKRRAFFEHRAGLSILRRERDDVGRIFQYLRRPDQSPEQVAMRLLNRFFDSKEGTSDRLILWMGHQFDARSIRYVAASQVIAASDLEVRVPCLPPSLASIFEDHYPDHVILRHKQMDVAEGLVLDRRLVEMLINGDRLTGLGTRNLEALTKIAAFYDRCARARTQSQSIVQVLRLDNMARTRIGINTSSREFYVPGAAV